VRGPVAKIAIVVTVVGVVMVALLIYAMLQQAKVSCEVCVAFHGNTDCRTAVGPTREEAIRTATDNACGLLASGMADRISCGQSTPVEVVCDGD